MVPTAEVFEHSLLYVVRKSSLGAAVKVDLLFQNGEALTKTFNLVTHIFLVCRGSTCGSRLWPSATFGGR
jgi:hypothetical protein